MRVFISELMVAFQFPNWTRVQAAQGEGESIAELVLVSHDEALIARFQKISINHHFKLLVTHNVEDHTDCEENHTKNAKCEHGAHGCGNRSPSRQSLLFEFRLFKFFYLIANALFFFCAHVHNYLKILFIYLI